MPPANAAIWFAADGYDPALGINGRRVAGESFLKGFFRHGAVDEFVSIAHGTADHQAFAAVATASGVHQPLRAVRLDTPAGLAPVDVISYPAPLPTRECWRRAPHGGAAWALCGVTHTTATEAIMQGIFDLRSAPQMPWDALICTSHAVQQSVRTLMELAEAHLAVRFPGAVLPARPLLPVIPLGTDCDGFLPDPALGAGLRQRLGVGPDDIVVSCIARLTPDEKFDPYPLFLALEAATPALRPSGGRFHLILCGTFREPALADTFTQGACRLMPSVGYHSLDGAAAAERKATLSASQIFVFPIDNLQETFGLAAVEAMAAGLPVIVSDWDGMKDTVTPDVGFRIPTEIPGPGEVLHISQRFMGDTDGYLQYLSQMSALTRIDVGWLMRALVTLGTDAEVRARMGAAGQARARKLYDWSVVIPQMQALWGEQGAMLAHARSTGMTPAKATPARLPICPAPDLMFASYPSHPAPDHGTRRLRAVATGPRPDVAGTFDLRDYISRRRLIEDPARLQTILAAFAASGLTGATQVEVAARTRLDAPTIARATLWLAKYHFLEEAP